MTAGGGEAIQKRQPIFSWSAPEVLGNPPVSNRNRQEENCHHQTRWRDGLSGLWGGRKYLSSPSMTATHQIMHIQDLCFPQQIEKQRRGCKKNAATSGCCRVFLSVSHFAARLRSPGMTPYLHQAVCESLIRKAKYKKRGRFQHNQWEEQRAGALCPLWRMGFRLKVQVGRSFLFTG